MPQAAGGLPPSLCIISKFCDLKEDAPGARAAFDAALRRHSFAVVAVDAPCSKAWGTFYQELKNFFAEPTESKERLGIQRFKGRQFGYQVDSTKGRGGGRDGEFVELRRAPMSAGGSAPSLKGAADAWDQASEVGRVLLRVVVEQAGLNPDVVMPLVDGPLGEGAQDWDLNAENEDPNPEPNLEGLSDTLFRGCCYQGAEDHPVCFTAHYDNTFLTLNPILGCVEEAGLQCKDAETGQFVEVEALLCAEVCPCTCQGSLWRRMWRCRACCVPRYTYMP